MMTRTERRLGRRVFNPLRPSKQCELAFELQSLYRQNSAEPH